jgi:hypothetical protein
VTPNDSVSEADAKFAAEKNRQKDLGSPVAMPSSVAINGNAT